MSKLYISELYAFIADDDEGEGVCGFLAPDGRFMAMVAADIKRVEALKPIARRIARQTGKTIKLARFSTREEVETIRPYAADEVPHD